MQTTTNTIDLRPYLPAQSRRKTRRTLHDIVELIGLVIEGAVTVGIGVCFVAGVYVFLTIV